MTLYRTMKLLFDKFMKSNVPTILFSYLQYTLNWKVNKT